MPKVTYPNQRTVTIHRETAKSDFLGIKNQNWQLAARDLGAHALMLYLYLASNADGFNLALSPVAVRQAIGMPRSTYHDQFVKLLDKGYLVETSGNGFDFFEIPQTGNGIQPPIIKNEAPTGVLNFDECPSDENSGVRAVDNVLAENIQINNTENQTNNLRTNKNGQIIPNDIYIPKEQIIRIPVPKAERKVEITPLPPKKEFIF